MKNEIEELMMLTPKRKSILWRYKSDEDESIFVYGISKGRMQCECSGYFKLPVQNIHNGLTIKFD